MVQSKAKTVDQYVRSLDAKRRPAIEAFRKLVKKAAPKAEEGMQYGMPCYGGEKPVVAFNAQKNYFSFYIGQQAVDRHRKELGKLDCGKGCIRGRKLEDFPLPVLEKMVREAAKRGGQC